MIWTIHDCRRRESGESEEYWTALCDVIRVPPAASQPELEPVAKGSQKVKPFLEGKTVKQVIVLPKKLVNLVVG